MQQMQKGYKPWAVLIAEIANSTNQGIEIERINATDQTSVLLEGKALHREDLQVFKQNLDESALFQPFERCCC